MIRAAARWLREHFAGVGPQGAGSSRRMALRASEADFGWLERAVTAALDGDREREAARLLRRAQKRFPGDPDWRVLLGDFYFDADLVHEAVNEYERAISLAPESAYPLAMTGACRLTMGQITAARDRLSAALARNPRDPDALYWRGVLHDVDGEPRTANTCFRRAARESPDDYVVPYRVSTRRFQELVEEAFAVLEERYPGFREALTDRNVEVGVQDMPTQEQIRDEDFAPTLLGVFFGMSVIERSLDDPWSALPSYITLFQRNIERQCRDEEELFEQIYITLLHEAAHAHGREEDWMNDRGLR